MAKSAYEKVYESLKKTIKKTNTSNFEGFFAFQFTVTGDAAGTFYMEFKNGNLSVENFDYKDATATFKADADTFTALVEGTLAPDKAIKSGKLVVEGNDAGCADIFNAIAPKKAAPAKKAAAPAKKPAAKKAAPAKKAEAKPAAPKTEAKPAAPKTEAKPAEVKPAAPKADAKPAAPKVPAKKPAAPKKK